MVLVQEEQIANILEKVYDLSRNEVIGKWEMLLYI
jgi:hypothetical protein